MPTHFPEHPHRCGAAASSTSPDTKPTLMRAASRSPAATASLLNLLMPASSPPAALALQSTLGAGYLADMAGDVFGAFGIGTIALFCIVFH